jgi:UDP-4-amino-4,6-dideoxy-N-acetyl-beta-L-altrosamine transaminase
VSEAFLPYARHDLDEADIESVVHALRSGFLTQGPAVQAFEAELKSQTGAPFAVAVNSGTAALHIAYAALGLGPGDELITSPITFVATANAARQLGASVVFADVDEQGNLDPLSVLERISARTRGIAAVHFAGLPADLAHLREIAQAHNLFLVEDAAHALGAEYEGSKIGTSTYSDLTTLSFHPVKHITSAEGGAVLGARPELQETLRRLREHGLAREPRADSEGLYGYVQSSLGYNYRLSDIHAALGVSQAKKLERFVERRRELAELYRAELASHVSPELVRTLAQPPGRKSAYHLFPVLIDYERLGLTRGVFMRELRARGIGSQVHYIPVNEQPYYRLSAGQCPRARSFFERELSLPMFPAMSDDDVKRVVSAVREVVSSCLFEKAV